MKPKALLPISVLLIASIGGYYVDHQREMKESVVSGYFECQPTLASSRLGGRVIRILVQEGETVTAKQPLVELEAQSYQASLGAAERAKEQADQLYLESSRGPRVEEIARQKAVVDEAQASLDRLLHGALPEEIRIAKARFAESQSQYQKVKRGPRFEEIESAKAVAAIAYERLRQAQRGLTHEEISQLHARLESARSQQEFTKVQAERQGALFAQGAIAKRDLDAAIAAAEQAEANTKDAQEAYNRGIAGTPKEELAQAQEAYRQAIAQRALVMNGSRKEDIEAARQEMLSAHENLLLVQRGAREEDILAARARLAQAKATLLELTNGNRREEVQRAKLGASQAEKQAASMRATFGERTIQAARNGQVDRVLVAVGDLVSPGSPMIQLSDPTDIWLRVYLPEAQLHLVKVGDSAELKLDEIPELIPGRVDSIATVGEFTPANLQSPEERGKQVFAIRIRLRNYDQRVKAGMYATVKRVGKWP